jgi:putative hydrolase of the HAD superfamily
LATQEHTISASEFIELYNQMKSKVNKQLHGQASCHSRLLYFQYLFEALDGKTKFDKPLKYYKLYWNSFFEAMEVLPEADLFLKKCLSLNIPIAIVTDLTTDVQLEKIQKLGIESYIKFLVSSEEAGKEKPEPEMFLLALQKLKLNSTEVIMIGDSLRADKAGAEALNIKWYHPWEG